MKRILTVAFALFAMSAYAADKNVVVTNTPNVIVANDNMNAVPVMMQTQNEYLLSDVKVLSGNALAFASDSGPRLVEGVSLHVANTSTTGRCYLAVGLHFRSSNVVINRNFVRIMASAEESKEIFIRLPRPAIVRPDAIPGAERIAVNVFVQESSLSGGVCSSSTTVFSQAAPQ